MFKSMLSKAVAACAVAMFAMLSVVASASAQLSIDAKDFTEPVETQLGAALPIVVGLIATIFVVGFVIRWIQKRANTAK